MTHWTPETILELAPDAASAKAGRDLATPAKWLLLGCDETHLWGECRGSGPAPYQTQIELRGSSRPRFECSCPSRKYPCKHELGLFLLQAEAPQAFAHDAAPNWVQAEENAETERPRKEIAAPSAQINEGLFADHGAIAATREDEAATIPPLPESWRAVLSGETEKPYFQLLREFSAQERRTHTVYPPQDKVFDALQHTSYAQVSVFILGQDPYHGPRQAHGMAFSVLPGIKPPPSLVNIFAELKDELGLRTPNNGYLVPWADQGVLLLNAVLTVRAHQANSHKGKGWEKFTDAVISRVSDKKTPVVFVLWGGYAQKKLKLIDESRHVVLQSAHPSPLSAHNGFFGSRPFSKINAALREMGKPEINWQLPDL